MFYHFPKVLLRGMKRGVNFFMIFLYLKNRICYRRENWYLRSPLKIKEHVFYHFPTIRLGWVKMRGEFFIIFLYLKNRLCYRRENWYLRSPLKIKEYVFNHFPKILSGREKRGGWILIWNSDISKTEYVTHVKIGIYVLL